MTDDLTAKERELLQEKARLIAEGKLKEPKTSLMVLRTTSTIMQLYRSLPPEAKATARGAFETAVLAWHLGGQLSNYTQVGQSTPIVFNININKAEANVRVNVDSDVKKLSQELDELEKRVSQLEQTLRALPSDLVNPQIRRSMDKNIYDIKTELYKAKRDLKELYVNLLKNSLQN